ncbi:hypothetical protein GC194_00615 [bacterium]|nr:hypothetical protein [bacterium]
MTAEEFKSHLRQVTFWDSPLPHIDVDAHKRYVISRIFTHGNMDEWRAMRKYYDWEVIIEEMKKVRSLDHMTLNFCAEMFHLPLNEFKCYNGERLDRNYWGF